jgi:hypothetical protein
LCSNISVFFSALRLLQVLYAPLPRQASIATFLSGFQSDRVPFLLLFVCFPCICFWFSLYLLLFLATSVVFFCFVFPYCFFACFLVCLQFCQSFPRLFHCPPFTAGAFFRAPTATSFQRYLHCPGSACTRSAFISLYFYCFFACNKSCLDQPAFGCDTWSRSLSCGCEHCPGFQVEEDKCWPEVLSPQCQGIIATYELVGFVWYRFVFHLLISHKLADLF